MQIKTFFGSFFGIGSQQGKIYRRNGMSFKNVKVNRKLLLGQLKVYRKYYPEMLEEFEGMAKSGGFEKDKLLYNFLCGEILWFIGRFNLKKSCTIFGVKNKNGVFIGRNYDWLPVTEKYFEVYRFINPERNSFIAITDMAIDAEAGVKPKYLFYNADDAINNKGLFIGLTFAYNYNWSYGLSCIHMTKLIAERCSTVKEAIKVFEKVPLCCPKHFFIADMNGDMAVIEHTSKKFRVLYPKNDILIQTNHYVDPVLAFEDTVLKENPVHNTFLRYYETLQKVNNKKDRFRLGDVIKILGDTESVVCQNNKIKTVWTLALDMKKRDYRLYWDLFGNRKEKVLEI